MAEYLFIGTWKLIACDVFRRNGVVLPIYGKNPVGRLNYDVAGNMSVHIMRAGRPFFRSNTKFRADPDEMRAAYESYEAYFSTYRIDSNDSLIHHFVIGGLFPNWTGTTQSRYYKFEGPDRLILSTAPIGAVQSDKAIVRLIWERLA